MNKKLNVYYAKVNNMGDNLNSAIIERCFNYNVKRTSVLYAKVSGIGSCLGEFTYGDNIKRNIEKSIFGIICPKVYIWGTGFISYPKKEEKFYKKNINFCAVRGELTKKRVENIIGKKLEIPTADAGILASYLLNDSPEKEYDVGIIAHFREKDDIRFKQLQEKFEKSLFIDVQDDPISVTKKIAKCKTILSSSLHGLIIADSLNIPNLHIVVTDKLLGDGFKFDDYYSAYGLEHEFIDLNKDSIDCIDEIMEKYKITKRMIDKKKEEMLECFPYSTIK